jgi:DNA polymerase/3'-5' exonuclease PolX
MSTAIEHRLLLSQAEAFAREVLALLGPACERIEIAGSIRRRKADVGDIELVAIPRLEEQAAGLFGTETVTVNHLDLLVTHLMADHHLEARQPRRLGSKYKALVFQGVPVDLFVVLPPAQFGWLFTIRTGPADFSHRLVTPQCQHGYLPNYLKAADGAVYHQDDVERRADAFHAKAGKLPYPMPEERDVFELLHLDYVPPELRQ